MKTEKEKKPGFEISITTWDMRKILAEAENTNSREVKGCVRVLKQITIDVPGYHATGGVPGIVHVASLQSALFSRTNQKYRLFPVMPRMVP